MRSHKKLSIWKEIVDMVGSIYMMTKKFPKEETYGIISQMRRASISIASNVAEGCARRGNQVTSLLRRLVTS